MLQHERITSRCSQVCEDGLIAELAKVVPFIQSTGSQVITAILIWMVFWVVRNVGWHNTQRNKQPSRPPFLFVQDSRTIMFLFEVQVFFYCDKISEEHNLSITNKCVH